MEQAEVEQNDAAAQVRQAIYVMKNATKDEADEIKSRSMLGPTSTRHSLQQHTRGCLYPIVCEYFA